MLYIITPPSNALTNKAPGKYKSALILILAAVPIKKILNKNYLFKVNKIPSKAKTCITTSLKLNKTPTNLYLP